MGDSGFHLLQLRGIDHLALLGLVQILIRLAGHICGIAVLLVVVVAHIGGIGQRVDQPVHIGRARAGVDNVQYIPCTGVVAGLRLLLVHAGPRHLAAAHIDGVARRNGDLLRPLEEAAALLVGGDLLIQEDLRQIVLVGGGGRQLQVGALAVDGQRVLVGITGLAGGELGQQLAALDVQRRKGGVGVAPCTAHIGAQTLAGVHDVDHVAVAQRTVLHGELFEAVVGEPVVQRAHPAGVIAAVHLGQAVDGGDIAALRAVLRIALFIQRRHDAVHHGAVGVQVDPLVDQLAVPVFLALGPHIAGKGGILHDDLHLAVVGGLTHGHHGGLIRLVHLGGGGGGLNGLHARVIGGLYAVAAQAVLHGVQAGDGGLLGGLRVAADRRPGDGHGHIVKARGHLQERVGDHLIALGGEAPSVQAGVVERGVPVGGVRLQTADRDALDGVLGAVDRIGHVAQHAGGVVHVLIRHIHGHAGVGNAPARAGDDAGAVLLALGQRRVAAQEVRGVVGIHAGNNAGQGRGLGDLGEGRAVVGAAGGVEGEQLRLHITADLRRVLVVRAGVGLQIGDHVRQRRLIGCGHAAVVLPERQLAGRGRGQFRAGDGVVLLLLAARQLAPLIDRHGLVAALELRHRVGSRGVQLGHIVGQLAQQAAELRQIALVVIVSAALQALDGLDGLLLGIARLAGGLCRVDSRHGGVVGVLHLLPVLGGEHALGVLLVVVHGVQLRAELLLHGVQIAGGGDVYQHGGAHGVAALIIQTERIQQHIALVVQGQGGLAALVRHGVGVHAQITGSGSLGALRRVTAVDSCTYHGTGVGIEVRQRRLRGHSDGERLARLHLHGGGNGAVTEPVTNIHKQRRIGAHLTGILDLLGIHPHQRQFVLVMEFDGGKRAVFAAAAQITVCIVALHQLAVQKYQRYRIDVIALQPAVAVQQIVGAGIGVQCHGAGIGILVVNCGILAHALESGVKGIQHGYLYADLILRDRFQCVDGLAQCTQGLAELNAVFAAHGIDHKLIRQLLCLCQCCPQRFNALCRIAAQVSAGIAVIIALDLLDFVLGGVLAVAGFVFIQRLAGRLQLRRQRLDALLRGGLVVIGGVALRVEHRSHQGLGLVADGLIGRPGLGAVVLRSETLLQFLVQQRGVGPASGDQVGDGGGEVSGSGRDLLLICCRFQHLLSLGARAGGRRELRPEACLTGRLAVPAVIGLVVVGVSIGYGRQQIGKRGLVNFSPGIWIG